MKIAVTCAGGDPSAPLDSRFGRAAAFLLFDTDTKEYQTIDNTQNLQAAQGAGVQAAQNVATAGAEVLLTGHVGPKAFQVFQAAKIRVYLAENQTVQEAVDAFQAGKLVELHAADRAGHWD